MTPDTKKRRIVSIVVLVNQSVFQRLMLIDYQIRLDLASGMVSPVEVEYVILLYMEQHVLFIRIILSICLRLNLQFWSCKCVTFHV